MLVVAGEGAGVLAPQTNEATLLAAVGAGKLALSGLLVSKRANVNAKDYSQAESPLLLACGCWRRSAGGKDTIVTL